MLAFFRNENPPTSAVGNPASRRKSLLVTLGPLMHTDALLVASWKEKSYFYAFALRLRDMIGVTGIDGSRSRAGLSSDRSLVVAIITIIKLKPIRLMSCFYVKYK